jgi:hypothetical protein
MCICPGIALLVFGAFVLITGKIELSRSRVVQGRPARACALILMVPVPVALAVIAFTWANRDTDADDVVLVLAAEGGFFFLCLLTALGVAIRYSQRATREPEGDEDGEPTDRGDEEPPEAPEEREDSAPVPSGLDEDAHSARQAADILAQVSSRLGLWSLLFCPLSLPAVLIGVIALLLGGQRRWAVLGIVFGSIMFVGTLAIGIATYWARSAHP